MEQETQSVSRNILSGKKQIFIIITTALITTITVGGFLYFVLTKPAENLKNNTSQVDQLVQPTKANDSQAKEKQQESDIVSDFTKSKYRVVAVLQNPFVPYSLIIATERSEAKCGDKENPARCTDDSICGSIYTSPNCYFFVEPHFSYGVDASTRFVGKWKGELDLLDISSIKFKDANNVQFSSAGGDAGYRVKAVWNLDLKTGEITQISREESNSQIE